MSPRRIQLALLAVVVLGVVGLAARRHVDPATLTASAAAAPGAPIELPVLAASAPAVDVDEWLNTEPLTADDLRGRVVLYDFWTYGCINCRNTLPYVKAWAARYTPDGLVVLSIHTPEFAYEADPANVAEFVAEEGITYPVALDPNKRVWRAFANRYWPAFYLHDRDGQRRLVHFGEGAYTQTEDAIRTLLGVAPDAPRAVVAG